MGGVLRIWGGSYHDYWFVDDAVLKVRLISSATTIVGAFVLLALALLYGFFGVILGAVVAIAIYFVGGRLAKRRHLRVAELSVQDVRDRGLVTLRIPYSVISKAELKGRRLTIFVEGRRVRIKVGEENVAELRSLLQSKLSDNFIATK